MFTPRNEKEWDCHVRESKQEKREPGFESVRPSDPLDENDRDAEQKPEQGSKRNERDRVNFLHRDLDPHEG
jgi:hypothetical protein